MDVDTSDLVTTRRNLTALSLLIVFVFVSGAEFTTTDDQANLALFGQSLIIPQHRLVYVWCLVVIVLVYLTWRFELLRSRSGMFEYFITSEFFTISWSNLPTYGGGGLLTQFKKPRGIFARPRWVKPCLHIFRRDEGEEFGVVTDFIAKHNLTFIRSWKFNLKQLTILVGYNVEVLDNPEIEKVLLSMSEGPCDIYLNFQGRVYFVWFVFFRSSYLPEQILPRILPYSAAGILAWVGLNKFYIFG